MLKSKLTNWLAGTGRKGLLYIQHLGQAALMLVQVLTSRSKAESFFPLLIKQIYAIGVLSLLIIVVAGLFIGMVLGLQGYNILIDYGSEQAVGQLVALSLVRELGPVVAGLLFAGRAGSALTAEIGLMKTTEQLSGMEMIGIDPLRQIVAPRFWAGVISMPLLAAIFSWIGILGGGAVSIGWLSVDSGAFWSNMQQSVGFSADILNGIIKSMVFGFAVIWTALFQGYSAKPTSEGISRATTRTVVYGSLAILGLDFVMTAIMFGDL